MNFYFYKTFETKHNTIYHNKSCNIENKRCNIENGNGIDSWTLDFYSVDRACVAFRNCEQRSCVLLCYQVPETTHRDACSDM